MSEARINVEWSPEDGEYVATSPQYPSLSWQDPEPGQAEHGLDMLISAIERDDAGRTRGMVAAALLATVIIVGLVLLWGALA